MTPRIGTRVCRRESNSGMLVGIHAVVSFAGLLGASSVPTDVAARTPSPAMAMRAVGAPPADPELYSSATMPKLRSWIQMRARSNSEDDRPTRDSAPPVWASAVKQKFDDVMCARLSPVCTCVWGTRCVPGDAVPRKVDALRVLRA